MFAIAFRKYPRKVILLPFTVNVSFGSQASDPNFESQLVSRLCCFKLLEVLYTRLSKTDLNSPESAINKAHCTDVKTGKELTMAITKWVQNWFWRREGFQWIIRIVLFLVQQLDWCILEVDVVIRGRMETVLTSAKSPAWSLGPKNLWISSPIKKKSHQQKFLSILWSSICGRYGNETVPGPVSKDSWITAETEVQPMQGLGSDKATKIQVHQLLQNIFFLTSNSWSVPHKDPDIFRNK